MQIALEQRGPILWSRCQVLMGQAVQYHQHHSVSMNLFSCFIPFVALLFGPSKPDSCLTIRRLKFHTHAWVTIYERGISTKWSFCIWLSFCFLDRNTCEVEIGNSARNTRKLGYVLTTRPPPMPCFLVPALFRPKPRIHCLLPPMRSGFYLWLHRSRCPGRRAGTCRARWRSRHTSRRSGTGWTNTALESDKQVLYASSAKRQMSIQCPRPRQTISGVSFRSYCLRQGSTSGSMGGPGGWAPLAPKIFFQNHAVFRQF